MKRLLKGRVADIIYLMNIVSGKLQTTYAIDDCLIEIKDENVSVKAANDEETLFMSITKKFEGSENGRVVIGSIRRLHEILNRFDKNDEVSLFEAETSLVVKRDHPLKEFKIDTIDEKLVKSVKLAGRIEFNEGVKIKGNSGAEKNITFSTHVLMQSAYIKDMLGDGSVIESNSDDVKYHLKVVDKGLHINLQGDGGTIDNEMVTDSVAGSDSASYGNLFAQVFNNIVGDVELHFITDSVLWISQNRKDLEINYLVK